MDHSYKNDIYIGSVLLEINRWAKTAVRQPSIKVSDWCRRIADAGFDGIELWENHILLASDEEQEKLKASSVPVKILNSYACCGDEAEEDRIASVKAGQFLGVDGMKFNFGGAMESHKDYCNNVQQWRSMLPDQFRFLCECHSGTTVQTPQVAADTFASLRREDYEVIIHGFSGDEDTIKRWFKLHADRITHIHFNLLGNQDITEYTLRKRFELLLSLGFCGSFTIEFTKGIGMEDESPEVLFKNAIYDMNSLRGWMK